MKRLQFQFSKMTEPNKSATRSPENVMESNGKTATFVFMDFESTDLLSSRTQITELCLLAVHRMDMEGVGTFPRVTNKLNICVNPRKPITASSSGITGKLMKTKAKLKKYWIIIKY